MLLALTLLTTAQVPVPDPTPGSAPPTAPPAPVILNATPVPVPSVEVVVPPPPPPPKPAPPPAPPPSMGLYKSFLPPAGAGDFNPVAVLGPPKTPTEKGEPRVWTGGVETGVAGSEGNSEIFKFRFGANAARRTSSNLLLLDLVSGVTVQNGVRNENKTLVSARDEILIKDSAWSPFLSGAVEYDEFRAFDFRYASHAGFSYTWFKNEDGLFKTRAGAGAMVEDSDTETRWNPEGLLGFDLEYRLTKRQRLVGSADYFPDLSEFERYRVRARAAWECVVDPETNLMLRVGVQNRYDSQPGNALPNDVDYFMSLMLRF